MLVHVENSNLKFSSKNNFAPILKEDNVIFLSHESQDGVYIFPNGFSSAFSKKGLKQVLMLTLYVWIYKEGMGSSSIFILLIQYVNQDKE